MARSYLRALSAGADPSSLSPFFGPEVASEEFPNLLLPFGARRDRDGFLSAWSANRSVWNSQSFVLLGATGGGSQVAMEVRWTAISPGRTDPYDIGQTARATLALFLKFEDQRIIRQRTYCCFELPVSEQGPREATSRGEAAGSRMSLPPSSVVSRPPSSNFDLARAYFELLSAGGRGEAIETFFRADATQEELPSRRRLAAVTRNLDAIRSNRDEHIASLQSERYELMGATGSGSKAALEIQWTGVPGVGHPQYGAAEKLESSLAVFLKFRDGLMVRQRIYECG